MTPDLILLRESLDLLETLVEDLELELVDDAKWAEPSDTSYLTEKDRENPDIMANVEAMAATNELIAWFGQDAEGFLGLWRGPDDQSLEEAPIVRLDSEGQYELVARTIGDFLAASVDPEEFATTKSTLEEAGFAVSSSQESVFESLEGLAGPNVHRHALYNQARAKRGLDQVPLE